MVESLIENVHREDLTPQEKGKFAQRIMKEENIESVRALAQRISSSGTVVSSWLDLLKVKKEHPKLKDISASVVYETKTLPDEQRIKVLEKAQKEDLGNRAVRQLVSEIKSGEKPEPIQLERTAEDNYNIVR